MLRVSTVLTLFKNVLGNVASKVFEPQGDHQNIVHLSKHRDKVRNELDGTNNIKSRTAGDHLRMPGNLRMYESSPEDTELLKKMLYRAAKLLSR